MGLPLMKKATAVWLVENSSLTFRQIANFCGLHELEVSGIADGEVAAGIRGMDPISSNQLTAETIKKCEEDPSLELVLSINPSASGEQRRRGPKYTPLSKRQDKPAAIAWLVKFHPQLLDSQIIKIVGTTKPTIQAVRNRTHWNISNITPTDPVALGLCKQVELDQALDKAPKAEKNKNEAQLSKFNEHTLNSSPSSLSVKDNNYFELDKTKSEETKSPEDQDHQEKDKNLSEAEKLFAKPGKV